MHDRVSILSREIRVWCTGVKPRSDVFDSDMDESINLSPGIHRGGTHLIIQSAITLAPVGHVKVQSEREHRKGPTASGMIKSIFTGYNAPLAVENPVVGLLLQFPGGIQI